MSLSQEMLNKHISKIKTNLLDKINEIEESINLDIRVYCNDNIGCEVFHLIDQ